MKEVEGIQLVVNGLVQGVGFRPFVACLAKEFSLTGSVRNTQNGVVITVFGSQAKIENLIARLESNAPRHSNITKITKTKISHPKAPQTFSIVDSETGKIATRVPLDYAICKQCRQELFDTDSSRYSYPFTHCTHCGPRYSILNRMPFDRRNTSMAEFTMCEDCAHEYTNPNDRRFHNQGNCCAKCGPQIWLEDNQNNLLHRGNSERALNQARRLIMEGKIIALKGIGGFNLLCDATNETAVARLRERKMRPAKPLAVLSKDLGMLSRYARFNSREKDALLSDEAPIVLLEKYGNRLPDNIAPGLNHVGCVLPYTALHILLMQQINLPLVFTSGNKSGQPTCIDNHEARLHLGNIAEVFVFHNREIIHILDDSVVQVVNEGVQVIRAGRGYAPIQTFVEQQSDHINKFDSFRSIFAMGVDGKSTHAIQIANMVFSSPPLDSIYHLENYKAFEKRLEKLSVLYGCEPDKILIDCHPEYRSSQMGEELALKNNATLFKVQHHHAHLASCLLEHQIPYDSPPILGVCFDGTGYSQTKEIWGGEFFLVNYRSCTRVASCETVPLLGGNIATQQPWRSAYAHLSSIGGGEYLQEKHPELELTEYFHRKPTTILNRMLSSQINSPKASSMGRLFDALAAMLDICREGISYEGQAAMALQALAEKAFNKASLEPYSFTVIDDQSIKRIVWNDMWMAILEDLSTGINKSVIAFRFHITIVEVISAIVDWHIDRGSLNKVVISGGVFQNRLLLSCLSETMNKKNIELLSPMRVPCNDAGIALGQVAVTRSPLNDC